MPVIVAVLPVWMMQVPRHQIVRMIPVDHRFMAAIRSVNVIGLMGFALMVWRTAILVGRTSS